MKKSDFSYLLPEALIAQYPLAERNASRLLHLERSSGRLQDLAFTDLTDLLSPADLIVFNNTKVIPARLFAVKPSGGKVEILIERVVDANTAIAHLRASKRVKEGTALQLEQGHHCLVRGRAGELFELEFPSVAGTVFDLLEQIGHIPLPPYIGREDTSLDADRYQTVFAQERGAVAAPTAGLHFDEAMLQKISAKGIATTFVTLHVGSGTFQPVRAEDIHNHVMHEEYYAVSPEAVLAVDRAKAAGGRVVAIGTTVVRALESASADGRLRAGCGDTRLFITPGYAFKTVDALLTNFHLPESTLLMLVCAFAGHQPVMAAYRHAVARQYRFFSYGDAMFLG